GLSISANANSSKGHEKGNGVWQNETTVDAGNQLTINSGRDTTLAGAQVSGETVVADIGRNLTITSLQDSDHYDSRQHSVSGGVGYTFGAGGFSGSISASRDKISSDYDSVQEQSGIFAGKGGFDVTVGNHTQLDGGVIASTAEAGRNRLDTGTLGFSDIHNQAEFETGHQGAGISSGGSIGSQFAGNMANGLLAGGGNSGDAEGTTRAAVSEGTLTIRDTANQQQDMADLSRDTEHANGSISPIFDKEKEQQRLQEVQLIGEIGSQAADIARTQGEIEGLNAARAKLAKDGKHEPEPDASDDTKAEYQKALRETSEYKTAMEKYGTGSTIQRGIQAATAALSGLAGGDIAGALAGASAPELAHMLKATEGNTAVNTIAHAILGGAVAAIQGNSAAAGAAGAATGELAAKAIAGVLYPGVTDLSKLTEEQKQTVSALATISAGMVGGLAGDSTESAVAGGQAGKNAAENNFLGDKDITTFTEQYANAKTDVEREQLLSDLKKQDVAQQAKALATGIPVNEQKAELEKLKVLQASPECNAQCQGLVAYSISELEPVANNTELHKNNLSKAVLAGVIFGLTVEKPAANNPISHLTREQQQLIWSAETITTAKGIQNPFPRDLNEKVLWNQVKKSPSQGQILDNMNKDSRFPKTAGFQKMQVNHELPDGSNITIHYQYNSFTGKAYDMKITTPQRNPLQPGPSLKDK
uniref:hemagglutinin repeat-containing protein n=1 Tax=Leclercia sp. Marseille-Q4284 TaxID=2866582 RepID=UPI00272D1321